MADVDLYGATVLPSPRFTCNPEDLILRAWESDIVRAARVRARKRGHDHYAADEWAQAARLRVWRQVRKSGSEPGIGLMRKLIAYGVRTPLDSDVVLEAAIDIDETDVVDSSQQRPDEFAVDEVRQWLRTLPVPLQRVYQLLFVNEYSQREAAAILGVSQPRIAQLHRALIERGNRDLQQLAA